MNDNKRNFLVGVSTGDCNLVRAVLDSGVPVDAPWFGHGATALVWAVGISEDMVRLLLERGAAVNVEDWEGVTPLHNAIGGRLVNIIKLLLEYGADLQHRSPWGTPLEEAERDEAEEIIDLIISASRGKT